MKNVRTIGLLLSFVAALASFASSARAFDDEPDELNWDRLGGTLTAFDSFCKYASAHKDWRDALLKVKPTSPRPTSTPEKISSVYISPKAFANDLANGWSLDRRAERDVLAFPPGHGGGYVRIKISIPNDGYYRVWTEYYHEQGTTSSFILRLEDPRVYDLKPMQTVVQDVFTYPFDLAEMGRVNDPLPTRKDEPTGFIWEASPTVWLEKGERTLTLSGTICDGPFAWRAISSIVLTQAPLARPESADNATLVEGIATRSSKTRASERSSEVAKLWERRPVAGETNEKLLSLWSQWRESFMNDLADYKVAGIEGRRLASLVAFDPASNLVGTPRQIRDEKIRTRELFDSFPQNAFMSKVEGEDFKIVSNWSVEGSSDASDGRLLTASYGDCYATAEYEFDVPRAGRYVFWSRYLELNGYLSRFIVRVEGADGTKDEVVLCNEQEENSKSPGFRWIDRRVDLPQGRAKVTLEVSGGPGLTYRRYDCLIVTDALDWRPEGQGEVIGARSKKGGLEFAVGDPWRGFSRFAPLARKAATEASRPIDVELPLGGVVSGSLLVHNNGLSAKTVSPQIVGDDAGLLSWRVQAFAYSPQYGWTPYPLLERSSVTIPPGETVGIWLTFNGDVESGDEEIVVRFGDDEARYKVARKGDLRSAPVPIVGGWSAPYETVSCWETFKRLGLNTINDVVIPSDEAKRYGIALTLKLNDADVSQEHIDFIKSVFSDFGYDYDDWAWSLMDEPGAAASDGWVELAKQLKERAPEIRLWCNPGEMYGATPESDLKMLPYVDCYCPYADHYWQSGGGNEAYQKELGGAGRKYDLRLTYTTPCFAERALGAPQDMFSPAGTSIQNKLDGWQFYALLGRYEYCNSPWDEANAYVGDQSVYLYRGAADRTISTRSAEAIRAAVDLWRADRLKPEGEKRE